VTIYDEDSIRRIEAKLREIRSTHAELCRSISGLNSILQNENAKEYLTHGAGRRLTIITRCVSRIFELFPVRSTIHLPDDVLADVTINLHAFLVNVAGIFDNLGWVYVLERDLFGDPKAGKLGRMDVGLLNAKTQSYLPANLREYLRSDSLSGWHSRYSKGYRDALAHRIPLYIPPSILNTAQLNEYRDIEAQLLAIRSTDFENLDAYLEVYESLLQRQRTLGAPSPFFTQSAREGGRPMMLHAQILSDHMTVGEVIGLFCGSFGADCP
jgi:hypothetical protein